MKKEGTLWIYGRYQCQPVTWKWDLRAKKVSLALYFMQNERNSLFVRQVIEAPD